ncbi:MAG TPA: antibiotic biosynthesis monooxygenase [Allocoleopsis sp.]
MSEEFLDFLKQKCAYVAVGEFKPGKFNEAKQLYEKAIATYGNGFKGSYLLQQPGTDKGIAIIFWDSVENMAEHENEAYKAILKEINPLFANPPVTGVYDLVNQTQPV